MGRTVTQGRTANLTESINGRPKCHMCGPCERGCATFSYFNAAYTTVFDAEKTGRCRLVTHAMAAQVLMDAQRRRATGIRYVDRRTRAHHELHGRVVMLAAQAFESVRLLLNSASAQDPAGLANSSGVLGKYLLSHFTGFGAAAEFPAFHRRADANGPRKPTGPVRGAVPQSGCREARRTVPAWLRLPGRGLHRVRLRGSTASGRTTSPRSGRADGRASVLAALASRCQTHAIR